MARLFLEAPRASSFEGRIETCLFTGEVKDSLCKTFAANRAAFQTIKKLDREFASQAPDASLIRERVHA